MKAESFKAHPDYNSATQQNDIAVVRVAEDIVFSPEVGPACLPFRFATTSVGTVVEVLGKGFNFLKLTISLYSNLCLQNMYFPTLHGTCNVTVILLD